MIRTILAATLATGLAATAARADVNVYSYRQPELLKPLTDAFTAETGIAVHVVFLKTGLVERLAAEGSRSPADVVMTVDISRLAALADAGVVQPVSSPVIEANIPPEFRDPDGLWFGLTARARVVYASRERVADGEVTTYEALADPKWRGRICSRSGTHVYTLGLISAMIAHHGIEATETWLAGLKANLARKPQGNDRAQVKAIWAGECDISLGNTYYMGLMLRDPEQREWAESVRIVFPVFEGGGTHVNISGMAMTRAAPNRADALRFMEWLSSPRAQEIYAEVNHEYPLLPGTRPSELVRSWGSFTPDSLPLAEIARHRAEALRLVERVDFDG
ncbi:MAG: Fe(3+) ABC transporter substrate-binding protein [Alphaproteobacteria bacterium]|nr:MAG: Fe(3+) ABC transporter substrate-binding protein [Alphaproteobacteria bacterium]